MKTPQMQSPMMREVMRYGRLNVLTERAYRAWQIRWPDSMRSRRWVRLTDARLQSLLRMQHMCRWRRDEVQE